MSSSETETRVHPLLAIMLRTLRFFGIAPSGGCSADQLTPLLEGFTPEGAIGEVSRCYGSGGSAGAAWGLIPEGSAVFNHDIPHFPGHSVRYKVGLNSIHIFMEHTPPGGEARTWLALGGEVVRPVEPCPLDINEHPLAVTGMEWWAAYLNSCAFADFGCADGPVLGLFHPIWPVLEPIVSAGQAWRSDLDPRSDEERRRSSGISPYSFEALAKLGAQSCWGYHSNERASSTQPFVGTPLLVLEDARRHLRAMIRGEKGEALISVS